MRALKSNAQLKMIRTSGKPRDYPYVSIVFTAAHFEWLNAEARRKGVPRSQVVREAVSLYKAAQMLLEARNEEHKAASG